MNLRLKIFMLVVCFLLIIGIYRNISKKKIDFKYALHWFIAIIFLMLLCLFDNLLIPIKDFFGFEVLSNMIFFIGFMCLSLIILSLSMKLSSQSEKITKLTQEISILKKEVKNDKKVNK